MKKVLKYFLYFCCFSILLITGFFSCSAINKASAVTSSDTHVVNFYGADNQTVIYSVNVPDGVSLNQISSSNIVLNSYFNNDTSSNYWEFNNTGIIQTVNDWYCGWGSGNATALNPGLGIRINYVDNYVNLIQYIPRSSLSAGDYYLSFYGDTSLPQNLALFWFAYNLNNQLQYVNVEYLPSTSNSIHCKFTLMQDIIDLNAISYEFGIQLINYGSYTQIDYANLNHYNYDYFNLDYVNNLYVQSGGVIGSNFEWSESTTSSSRFNFDHSISSDVNLYGYNFNGQTYDYVGEVSSDYGNLGNYAISDIEFFEVSGTYLYHVVYDTDLLASDMTFLFIPYNSSISSETICDSFYVNSSNSSEVFNIFGYSEMPASTGSGGGFVGALSMSKNDTGARIILHKNYGKVHFYFSLLEFNPTSRTTFELVPDSEYSYTKRYYDDLTSIVDMKSSTNFNFNLNPYEFDYDTSSLNYQLLDYLLNNIDYTYKYSVSFVSNSLLNSTFELFYNLNDSGFVNFVVVNYSYNSYYNALFLQFVPNHIVNNDFVNFNVVDCFFFVHRPVQRVDNTLVIYNFDYYNILYSVNGITYQLQADGDLYNVNYSGSVPNDYFIYISNEDVINTIFDEYVHVYLTFDNNNIILKKVDDTTYTCDFGFDFNFTYYVQPLVTNNGVYNYDFEKPGYVEMPFSLNPLHIPLLEMIENAFIFIVFYCPLISDVLTFLRFDYFFGGLINIVNFITNSEIGDFILSCFAFLILWSLLKSIFPTFVTNGREVSQSFVNTMVDTSDFIDSKSVHRYKGYKFKSGLGSNIYEQIKVNHLKRFNYVGYRGKKNYLYKDSHNRIAKMKKRR